MNEQELKTLFGPTTPYSIRVLVLDLKNGKTGAQVLNSSNMGKLHFEYQLNSYKKTWPLVSDKDNHFYYALIDYKNYALLLEVNQNEFGTTVNAIKSDNKNSILKAMKEEQLFFDNSFQDKNAFHLEEINAYLEKLTLENTVNQSSEANTKNKIKL